MEQKIIEKAKELRLLLKQSKEVQDNPVKRLEWSSTLQDIIDYLSEEND